MWRLRRETGPGRVCHKSACRGSRAPPPPPPPPHPAGQACKNSTTCHWPAEQHREVERAHATDARYERGDQQGPAAFPEVVGQVEDRERRSARRGRRDVLWSARAPRRAPRRVASRRAIIETTRRVVRRGRVLIATRPSLRGRISPWLVVATRGRVLTEVSRPIHHCKGTALSITPGAPRARSARSRSRRRPRAPRARAAPA